MLPSPPWFWDSNNNGGADDTQASVDADGSGWTQTKLDRLNEAVAEWSSSTDFDPYREYASGPNKVFVDGSQDPNCPLGDALAVTCTYYIPRTNAAGSYRDIESANTRLNLSTGSYTWWVNPFHE